jgi:hypothetical protein
MCVCRAAQQHGVDVAWHGGMWACGRCSCFFFLLFRGESDSNSDSDSDGDGNACWQSRAAQRAQSSAEQSRPACRMRDCFGRGAAA